MDLALIGGGVAALVLVLVLIVVARSSRMVARGTALIVNRMQGEPRVVFTGVAVVLPVVNRVDVMDLTAKRIVISRKGKDGAICHDGIRADVEVTFVLRVNDNVDDVLRVAQRIGCERAADLATLESLFEAKFGEAIKVVLRELDFEAMTRHREEIRDKIMEVVGRDLGGFVLDDVAIDYLEQTPLQMLDPSNVLDAPGIRKIVSMSIDQRADARLYLTGEQRSWSATLADRGLRDVQVVVEVSCDVPASRGEHAVQLGSEEADALLSPLYGTLAPATIVEAGRAVLVCERGRATLRWVATDVTTDQLVAGARIVHALRSEPGAYR